MNTTETVYKNRSNDNEVKFYQDLVAMDLSTATSIELKLYTNDGDLVTTHTSTDSPSLISVGVDTSVSPNTNNVISFDLNNLALLNEYYAQVTIYDPTHTEGQVIAHPESPDDQLTFNFVEA